MFTKQSSKVMKVKYNFHKTTGGYEESYPHLKRDKRAGDCVIRAIAVATQKPFKTVMRELCDVAVEFGIIPNEEDLYKIYLERLGFKEYKLPKSTRMDSDLIPRDRFVICAQRGHLVTIKGFDLFDFWNSSWNYGYKDGKPTSRVVFRLYYKS